MFKVLFSKPHKLLLARHDLCPEDIYDTDYDADLYMLHCERLLVLITAQCLQFMGDELLRIPERLEIAVDILVFLHT